MLRFLKAMTASGLNFDAPDFSVALDVKDFKVGTALATTSPLTSQLDFGYITPDFSVANLPNVADLPNIPVIAPASASVGISTDLQWAHCPISWMPFEQPVVAADGHTYDYESITQFFRNTPPPVMGPMRIKIGNKFLVHNWHLIASLGNLRHFDIAPEFNNPDNDTDSDDNNSEDPV